jgi:tripartite-type tricarboxylate transporter receptor subunit TctC
MMKTISTGLVLAASLFASGALAQNWPQSDIRYVLHVNPGGATDVMARRLADGLQPLLGRTIVVENHGGGSGARQMAQLQLARDADHTIGSVTASHLGMFVQTGSFSTDSVEWACNLVLEPYLLAVRADSPIQSLADLVERARANPGGQSIAGFGEASGGHIAWAMFVEAAGLDGSEINWVPYDSVGDGVVAALGGHNDVAIAYVGLVRQHVEAGTMRVLGIHSETRSTAFPDVPTYAEAGFAVDNNWQQFRGVIMPDGASRAAMDALCGHVEAVLQTPEMAAYIAESELVPGFMGPDEFRAFVDAQDGLTRRWTEILSSQN